MGRLLGTLLFYTARGRRLVCERNISVSFPELTPTEQKKLVKECFIENGVGLTETAWSWHRPIGFINDKVVVSGQEILHAQERTGTIGIQVGRNRRHRLGLIEVVAHRAELVLHELGCSPPLSCHAFFLTYI